MLDVLQIAGALLILVPFSAQQFGRMSAASLAYLWPNLVGSVLLAGLAVHEQQWGFVLLETVWAAVAAWSLTRLRPGGGGAQPA